MICPAGYTETEIIAIIDRIVDLLKDKFVFGYIDKEDLRQQGRLFAIEAMSKYNDAFFVKENGVARKTTIDNFLYRHIRNRFINFKRDNYTRYQSPCLKCPFFDPNLQKSKNQCAVFEDRSDCDKFHKWDINTTSRKNLVDSPKNDLIYQPIHSKNDTMDNIEEDLDMKELVSKIDRELPRELRADYLRMRDGVTINKQRRDKVELALKKILYGEDD